VSPADVLRTAVSADPARPLLTSYDDASGERTELSGATYANWVAKTANLLVDGLGVAPGERVALMLPLHWHTAVWLGACWVAGVVPVPGAEPDGAEHLVVGPDDLDALGGCAGERVAVSLRPFGGFVTPLPAGVLDWAGEVLAYGDHFPARAAAGDSLALVDGELSLTESQLVGRAREVAAAGRLSPTDRVLVAGDGVDARLVVDGLLAPLTAGASLVWCRNLDPALLVRRVETERVTATRGPGVAVAGVRSLD